MSYKLNHKTARNNGWYEREVARERAHYEEEIKNGAIDKGFVWPSVQLEIFLEGVFTQKHVPSQIEINVPNGIFSLTTLSKEGEIRWLVRNDTFGAIAEVNPEDWFKWAAKVFPEGIGNEGYMIISHSLLCIGCKDENEVEKMWKEIIYAETEE